MRLWSGEAVYANATNADTQLSAVLTVEFAATLTAAQPMYDATTGTSSTTMALPTRTEQYQVSAGYAPDGSFVYDQTQLGAPGNPATEAVNVVRSVRVRGNAVEMRDASGVVIASPLAAGASSLMNVLGTDGNIPLLMENIVVTQFPQPGTTVQRGSTTAAVSSVTTSGPRVTVTSTMQTGLTGVGATTERRVYTRRNALSAGRGAATEYELSRVETDVNAQSGGTTIAGQVTVAVGQLQYTPNAARDAGRQSGALPGGYGDGAARTTYECEPDDFECQEDYNNNTGSGHNGNNTGNNGNTGNQQSGCGLLNGGATLVYVHGWKAGGGTWGPSNASPNDENNVRTNLRCALELAVDPAPSLDAGGDNGTGPHAAQASELSTTAAGFGDDVIFVGQSQGGLISRRVAQMPGWGAARVRGVVTAGTPHLGAPVANTLAPGGVLNTLGNVLDGPFTCGILACGSLNAAVSVIGPHFFSSPAMADLRPGSQAISDVNAAPEAFPRFGIQHAIPKRWAFARVGGDLQPSNEGDEVARAVSIFYSALVVAAVATVWNPFTWGITVVAVTGIVVMNSADRAWNNLTVGYDQGDGVVPYQSQVYPGADFNYLAPDPVSHMAQTDTDRAADAYKDVLVDQVGVTER